MTMQIELDNQPNVSGRPATIYDVAEAAGVSAQTVSRLLRGFEGIRPETRQRVEQAIASLDYRPNLTARMLKTGRSHRIGALTHSIDQIGPNQIVRGAAAAARQAGYVLDIVTFDMADPQAISDGLDIVMKPDLAGILILASTDEMIEVFERTEFRVPVHISIDGGSVGNDVGASEISQVVDHIWSLGHRKVFHISGPLNAPAARHRRSTLETELAARGCEPTGLYAGDWSSASGYSAVACLPEGTTAVVAANDQMALGALRALQERGLRVPSDISVTGVDDIPEAEFLTPSLTTVKIDFVAQGSAAFYALMNQIYGGKFAVAPELTSQLIARESTGPVSSPVRSSPR